MSDWLHRFVCDPDWASAANRLWQCAVWSFGDWSVATDSLAMVALRDGGASESQGCFDDESQGCFDDDRPAVRRALAGYFDLLPPARLHTTIDALWSFVGRIDARRCPNCGDPWECEVDRNLTPRFHCEDCDGTGIELAPEPRPALVAGVPLDVNRLARWLAPELADNGRDVAARRAAVVVSRHGFTGPVDSVCFDGGAWRVWVCGMDPRGATVKDAGGLARLPSFHPDPVFAQLWLERDDPDARPVLADWLDERGDPYHEVLRG